MAESIELRSKRPIRNDYNPEEIYLCFICSEILEHPIQSRCGIRICKKCLPNDLCQSCKIKITNDHYYDKSIENGSTEIKLRRNSCKIIKPVCISFESLIKNDSITDKIIDEIDLKLQRIKNQLNECSEIKIAVDQIIDIRNTINNILQNRKNLVCYNCTKQNKSTVVWRIDNFSSYRNDKRCILTEPINIKQSSYNVCLKIYPNGDSEESVNHISLFFVLCKGKYDEILNWPYKNKFRLKMLSQNTDDVKHHSETFIPSNDLRPFQRPINEMNVGSGNPCFLKYNKLVDDYFLDADGSLFVELTVYW